MLVTVALIAAVGLQWGIDFTGGSLLEVASNEAEPQTVRQFLAERFQLETIVQTTAEGSLIIRTTPLDEQRHQEVVTALLEAGFIRDELRFESIGPTIGATLRQRALIGVGLATIVMIAYLAYTFRALSRYIASWKFGVAAVVALLHDLLVMTATMAILGRIFGAPIDSLFLTAALAIMGFSVNDTIVLFDRLNTLWREHRTLDLSEILWRAIQTTVIRSLNTSITALLVMITLFFFGGTSLRWFTAALIAGTISGSYSTLMVAPPVLYMLARRRR